MNRSEREELIRRSIKDTIWLLTGSGGVLLQIQLNQVSLIGMAVCLVLLGVPIRNITSLIQNGDASMPVPPSSSPSVSASRQSSRQESGSVLPELSDGYREPEEGTPARQ